MTEELDSPFVEINHAAVAAKRLQRKQQSESAGLAKAQEGRYTLQEAGALLDSATNNGGEALLMEAAMSGTLKVHAPGNAAELPCSDVKEHRNYLEAYWDNLNGWIEENVKRITFRFPSPSGKAQIAAPATKAAWLEKSTAIAEKYISEWRKAGYEPTKSDAALYVEGAFSTDGIYGDRGNVLDAAYIERHALKGITGKRPGEKSKLPKVPDGLRGKLPISK